MKWVNTGRQIRGITIILSIVLTSLMFCSVVNNFQVAQADSLRRYVDNDSYAIADWTQGTIRVYVYLNWRHVATHQPNSIDDGRPAVRIQYFITDSGTYVAKGDGFIPRSHIKGVGMGRRVLDIHTSDIQGDVSGSIGSIHLEWIRTSDDWGKENPKEIIDYWWGARLVHIGNLMIASAKVRGNVLGHSPAGDIRAFLAKIGKNDHIIDPQN